MKDYSLIDYTIGNTTTQETPDKAKNKAYFWAMEEKNYSINLQDLSSFEDICFPDSFEEYSHAVEFLLRRKNIFLLEDDILEAFKENPDVQREMERGNKGMGAVRIFFPKRFVRETIHPKKGGEEHEGVYGWLDLWSDYIITQQEELY